MFNVCVVQRSFRPASYRLSSWILLTLQGKCKASAKSNLFELCRAAAFTRTRNFLFASTKLIIFSDSIKHISCLKALISTYNNL